MVTLREQRKRQGQRHRLARCVRDAVHQRPELQRKRSREVGAEVTEGAETSEAEPCVYVAAGEQEGYATEELPLQT